MTLGNFIIDMLLLFWVFPHSFNGSAIPKTVLKIISKKVFHFLFFFFLKILFIFRERVREGEREGEKHHCVVASHVPPTGDLACNLGVCPE